MARVADEELKKAFGELHEKVIETTQKLKLADIQIDTIKRSKQRAELTIAEISGLSSETKTYEPVGRMFWLDNFDSIKNNMEAKMKASDERVMTLENNKMYLERSLKESKNNIREMVQQKQNKESSG